MFVYFFCQVVGQGLFIPSYLKQTIVAAYRSVESAPDSELLSKCNIKAHQVHHVAHSLGQLGSLSPLDIIRTGGWTSPSTFVNHYPQDLSIEVVNGLAQVGSFVAIESIFSANRAISF